MLTRFVKSRTILTIAPAFSSISGQLEVELDPSVPAVFKTTDTLLERHIGPSSEDQLAMLRKLGYNQMESLLDDIVPQQIHAKPRGSAFKESGKVKHELKRIQSESLF